MPILKSAIDKDSKEFAANRTHMEKLVADLRQKQAQAALGGDEKARKKHTDRGKLLPRERIEALLDRGSPFLELSRLPPMACTTGDAPCAGHYHRHRPGAWPRSHGGGQRRHRERRHLLSRSP